MKTGLLNKITVIVTALALLLTTAGLCSAAQAAEADLTGATAFVFSDGGISVEKGDYTGYKISGTTLTLTGAGVYAVSGSCANGAITVKKNVSGVTLALNGLTLTASATAPITCGKGSEVNIVAAAGTVNNLADDKYNNDDVYTDENLYPDIENAVIKCKDGSVVTISGGGTINVSANGKNGVKGGADLYEEDADGNATDTLLKEASLTVKDVTLNITATVGDGLKSDRELNILSGNITVSAADDGIKSEYTLNIGAEGTDGPTVTVKNSVEGIEAATLNVYSGNITVNATDDGINAANSDLTNYDFSYNQYGGRVYVNVTAGDGVDANGSINLYGGELEVYTPSQGDGDPLDADAGVSFSGASVLGVGNAAMAQRYTGTFVSFGSGAGMGGRGGFGQTGGQTLVTAGSTVTVTDASGNVLCTATAVRNAAYVVFASPALVSGETYTLKVNGSAVSSATAGGSAGGQGGFPGGPGGDRPEPPEGGPGGDMPTPPGEFDPTAFVFGDVDGSGVTDVTDARLALRAAIGLDVIDESSPAFRAADADGSGAISVDDARLILRVAIGLDEPPAPPAPPHTANDNA